MVEEDGSREDPLRLLLFFLISSLLITISYSAIITTPASSMEDWDDGRLPKKGRGTNVRCLSLLIR